MAFTLDQIKKYSQNPGSIPAPGSYGEGRVTYAREMLDTLKSSVKSGQLTLSEFQEIAPSLVKTAQASAMAAGGRGGSGAVWQGIVNDGFANASGQIAMPFTRQEYAKLPDTVLPTQEDINSGMFDPTNAPLQRVRKVEPPTPAVNPGPGTPATPTTPTNPTTPTPSNGGNNATTTPGVATPNSQTGNAPIYTAAPNNPPPYGGLASTSAAGSFDAQRIAQEGALQQQLSTQNQEGITAKRQQYLNDLSKLLVQQQQDQLNQAAPGIYEDLNSRGLLRSSELGNAMSREAANLQKATTNQLAQYGIQGATADLGNYQNIQNNYNDSRNTALNREFSIEDYNRQVQTGKELGEQYANLKPADVKAGKNAAIGTVAGGVGGAVLGGAPGAAAGAQIGGAAGTGASSTSYICLELIRRGLASRYDLDMLHYEIMPAVFQKARAFYHYAMNGRALVAAANARGIDWKLWVKPFLGDVIGIGDPIAATETYARAFKALCMECAPHLWDERVMRTGLLDSLLFLPKLLVYKPYINALIKTTKMRMRFILDVPHEVK